MKIQRICRWAPILFILILLTATHARADGGYFSSRAVAALSADQRAIILKNGEEISITFSTGYTGEGEEFGWIIPTPVPPMIEDVREAGGVEEAFQILDKHTAPEIRVWDPSKGCFPPGTQVLTADGHRAIETVNPGTEVYAYDLAAGQWILKRVLVRHTHHYEGDVIAIRIGQDTIRATGNHPFYVLRGDRLASRPLPADVPKEERGMTGGGRWVEARDLKEDDILMDRGGEGTRIAGLSSRHETTDVYNLEIEGHHNYAVHLRSILVHNKGGMGQESSGPLVTVYGTVTLEHYEVSILKAADASGLLGWLGKNGYQIDPAAREIIDGYIDRNWAFVAAKLNPREKRHYENEFLPPLTVRYRYGELVFPLRISSVSTNRSVKIALYVIAESTVSSSNLPTASLRYDPWIVKGVNPENYVEACVRRALGGEGSRGLVVMWSGRFIGHPDEAVMWTEQIDPEEGKRLRPTLDGLMRTPFSGTQIGYLTRLETRMVSASMTEDIELVLDSQPRHFEVVLNAYKGYDSLVSSRETELIAASQVGERERVEELLAAGADVDPEGEGHRTSLRTALMMAVRSGHLEVVRILLEAGADLNTGDISGKTALMRAAGLGDVEIVKILLEAGSEVNAIFRYGGTALRYAAEGGHGEVVKILLEAGADVNAVAAGGDGDTALMGAAGGSRFGSGEQGGGAGVVRMLLAAGADVNAKQYDGKTALMRAVGSGPAEVVRILVEAGADVNASAEPGEYYGYDGRITALIIAARRGDPEIVRILVRAGADVHATTSDGESALTSASGNGHAEVVRTLVQAGADVNASSRVWCQVAPGVTTILTHRRYAWTALKWAADGGHIEVVKILLEAGANVNARSADGLTALAIAKKEGHAAVANFLLQAGARD